MHFVIIRSISVRSAFFACIAVLPLAAKAESGTSPWVDGLHTRARLIAGSPASTGAYRAGVEIQLDEGFKTYWRSPGDAGVPPVFDFTKSANLKAVDVHYPAPTAFPDGGGTSIGYKHNIVLPLSVTPIDPAKPVTLAMDLNYAVCSNICIPAQANAELTLTGKPHSEPGDGLLAQFEALVPSKKPLAAAGAPAIIRIEKRNEKSFRVITRVPPDGVATLFADGPAGWYYDAAPAEGSASFVLTVAEIPKGKAIKDGTVTLTLVTAQGAIETEVALDAAVAKP